jgi:FkbM family methyltransferase
MKKILSKILALLGYKISKIGDVSLPAKSMNDAVEKVSRFYDIKTIIDIGASSGIWSRMAMKYYPEAKYLLIEAQPVHEPALIAFTTENINAQYTLSAAGETSGQIYFDASDPYSGQAAYTPYPTNNITVPVVTVDGEVNRLKLNGLYLLKLDTHGFEVPIFEGAMQTLKDTAVIIVECYNFRISPECLLFHEMCEYLGQLGFRCIDLADPLWRPYDQAFWQMDLIFIRKDDPEFAYSNYQ